MTAEAGDQQVVVRFTAGENGAEATYFEVETSPADVPVQQGTESPITVTGLTNGTAYTFRVRTVEGDVQMEWSEASEPVVAGMPKPPIFQSIWQTGEDLCVRIDAPSTSAFSKITSYELETDLGGFQVLVLKEEAISGRDIITKFVAPPIGEYRVRIRVHAYGTTGAWSEYSEPLFIAGIPDAPQNVTITDGPEDFTAMVTWEPPAFTGGVPIAVYELHDWERNSHNQVHVTNTSFLLENLLQGEPYKILINSRNTRVKRSEEVPTTPATYTPIGTVAVPGQPFITDVRPLYQWNDSNGREELCLGLYFRPGSFGGLAPTGFVVEFWDRPEAEGYLIERRELALEDFNPQEGAFILTSIFEVLSPGVGILIRMAQRNDMGVGPFSDWAGWHNPPEPFPPQIRVPQTSAGDAIAVEFELDTEWLEWGQIKCNLMDVSIDVYDMYHVRVGMHEETIDLHDATPGEPILREFPVMTQEGNRVEISALLVDERNISGSSGFCSYEVTA